MRNERAVIAIDASDHEWLTSVATSTRVSVIDLVRFMVAHHKARGFENLESVKKRRALERIEAKQEELRLAKEAILKELTPNGRKRRIDTVTSV